MTVMRVEPDAVKRKLKFDYMKAKSENTSKVMDGFSQLLAHFHKQPLDVRELMQDAASFIQRHFRLRWVMIGLRSPSDGLYRYEFMSGMRDDAWAQHRKKAYKLEDFTTYTNYKGGDISRLSRVYLQEENVLYKEDEEKGLNRPALYHARRLLPDDVLEADYIDTLIIGYGETILGWIEFSGSVTGKLPDPMTIRSIETISTILGAALASAEAQRSAGGSG